MAEDNAVDLDKSTDTGTKETPNYEAEARKYGWVPKDEFRGDETEWRDAPEFVKRGQEILGFVRKELGKTKDKLSATEMQFEQFKQEAAEFRKYREKAEENAYKRAVADLKEQKKKAVELGDGEALVLIEEEMDTLKSQKAEVDQKNKQEVIDPVMAQNQRTLKTWLQQDGNEPFENDQEVQKLANKYADVVRLDPKTEHLTGSDYLDEIAERVRQALPEKFGGNPAKNRAAAVGASSDGGASRSGTKKKSYADLPEDGKKHCDKFVKNGWTTKEKYVEDYFLQFEQGE